MNENQQRTYYKNFHQGFTKDRGRGMTKGDVVGKLGRIKTLVFKHSEEFLLVRDLKEILGRCGYYLTENALRRMTTKGALKGRKWNELKGGMWYYAKGDIYSWVDFLIEEGISLLLKRKVIKKEEKVLDLLIRPKRNQV